MQGKPDKEGRKAGKERGQLEVMINFTVKAESATDKQAKHKQSLTSLKNLGAYILRSNSS